MLFKCNLRRYAAADEHVDKLEKRFKVGNKVRARVVGHRALDGVANVSLKPSVGFRV
jgi:rRNA biogenesis protein RRP5